MQGEGGRLNRRSLGRAAVGVVGASALSSRRAAAQAGVVEDEFRVLTDSLFAGLDPVHGTVASSVGARLRSAGAAEGLLKFTPQAELGLDLAGGYELIDPLTWQVTLRPGVAFWSGRAVDAAAVVESLERSRALAPAAAALLQGVRIEAADERTLRFRTDAPALGLPMNLASEELVVHNAQAYGPAANAFDVGAADLTGCFRFASFEPSSRATLVRHERYWGPAARMARLRFDEVLDPEARALAALSGEAHSIRGITSPFAAQIDRSRPVRLVSVTNASTGVVHLNSQKTPFDDVRVRQAAAWAIDRDEMVLQAHDGRGTPYPSYLAAHPGYPEAKKVGYTRQDLARAAQLLDDAGWRLPPGGRVRAKDGVPLRFRLYWWGSTRPQAEVLQAHWAKLGVDADVQGSSDATPWLQRAQTGDWEAFITAWNTVGDPAAVFNRLVGRDGVANYAKFRDPELERLLSGFDTAVDAEARREQALRLNQRQAEVVPFIPIASQDRLGAVSRRVRNYVPHYAQWIYEIHPDLWVEAAL